LYTITESTRRASYVREQFLQARALEASATKPAIIVVLGEQREAEMFLA
jgi:hypothetical protein